MIRRIPLSTATNMRDLGGHPAVGGHVTRYGSLFRSDCPNSLMEEDVAWIRKLNVRTVIDMRSSRECEEMPGGYSTLPGMTRHMCPFTLGSAYPATEEDIPGTYLEMFADWGNMSRILSLISEAEGAVVFHCVAGKDRTGVVAAVLLTIAGVALPDVLADYQVSHTYLREFLLKRRLTHPDMPVWAGRSESWYLEKSLTEMMRLHRGIDGYLDQLGITAIQRTRLRGKLLG